MKKSIVHFFSIVIIFVLTSCKKDNDETPSVSNEQRVESALNGFVAELIATPPNPSDLSDRIRQYLLENPSFFFGSTVTLLDTADLALYSPYWYRSGDSLSYSDLMDTAYHIDDQAWLRQPIDSGFAIWTEPYFDTGGGNIWMKTRSVPVIVNGQIVAVATTDLAL
ncbi:MAG: cache domain-containing protein [Bacteroidota bacterium]